MIKLCSHTLCLYTFWRITKIRLLNDSVDLILTLYNNNSIQHLFDFDSKLHDKGNKKVVEKLQVGVLNARIVYTRIYFFISNGH